MFTLSFSCFVCWCSNAHTPFRHAPATAPHHHQSSLHRPSSSATRLEHPTSWPLSQMDLPSSMNHPPDDDHSWAPSPSRASGGRVASSPSFSTTTKKSTTTALGAAGRGDDVLCVICLTMLHVAVASAGDTSTCAAAETPQPQLRVRIRVTYLFFSFVLFVLFLCIL